MPSCPKRASLEGLGLEIFKLVSRGASPEQWAEWLRAPLEHAAAEGNLGLVDKLIGAGADGSAGWRGCGGRTILHAAAVGGSEGVVLSLLKAGAKPDVNVLPSDPPRSSALYLAAKCGHEAVGRRLILAGAGVNFIDPEDSYTVLHAAIWGGHERLSEELIMSGADIMARTSNGSTPLHLAVEKGLEGVTSTLLLNGADKDAVDNEGYSALMFACGGLEGIEPKLAVVETLLAAGVDLSIRESGGWSALDWTSQEGFVSILRALVRRGADVNSRDPGGCSALHTAALYDQSGAVDALIEAGADIELKSNVGRTPLCCAAGHGQAKSILALLRQGASVGARDNYGETALHRTCRFQREGLAVVVDLLLRWGADETAVNEDGGTPVDALGTVHADRTCSQDEVDRVRLLLGRAPADRAWRRRGWLVMLRARALRARSDSNNSGDRAGLERSNAAGGRASQGRTVAKREGGSRAASGEQGQSSRGGDGVGGEGGGGKEAFHGAVTWLAGMEPKGVFRTILDFI